MKLNVKAFAVTCSLVWGLGLFCITWWVILLEGPSDSLMFLGRVYLGFTLTPAGSLIGLLWGLADGAVGGLVFAWLYNRLAALFS